MSPSFAPCGSTRCHGVMDQLCSGIRSMFLFQGPKPDASPRPGKVKGTQGFCGNEVKRVWKSIFVRSSCLEVEIWTCWILSQPYKKKCKEDGLHVQKMMKMFHDTSWYTGSFNLFYLPWDWQQIFPRFRWRVQWETSGPPTATKRNSAKPVDIADTDFPNSCSRVFMTN